MFGILFLLFFGMNTPVFAETVSPADLINAEALSNAWYSAAKINTGDIININAGNRIIQIKILDIKEIEVKKPIPEVVKTPMEKVTDTANTVVDTANQLTNKLANYVESFKTPTESSPDSAGVLTNIVNTAKTLIPGQQNINQEKVLGVSTENVPAPATKNILQKLPFYNPLLDLVVFLIHQWVWVLAAILLFIIYLIFT